MAPEDQETGHILCAACNKHLTAAHTQSKKHTGYLSNIDETRFAAPLMPLSFCCLRPESYRLKGLHCLHLGSLMRVLKRMSYTSCIFKSLFWSRILSIPIQLLQLRQRSNGFALNDPTGCVCRSWRWTVPSPEFQHELPVKLRSRARRDRAENLGHLPGQVWKTWGYQRPSTAPTDLQTFLESSFGSIKKKVKTALEQQFLCKKSWKVFTNLRTRFRLVWY